MRAPDASPVGAARRALRPLARGARRGRRSAALRRDAVAARRRPADLSLFHEFAPPPGGGGNQCLRSIVGECERRGLRVENNTVSPTSRAVLFNSFNFDVDRLAYFARRASSGCRFVHRIGGAISLYRGFDDGSDRVIAEANRAHAHASIAISQWTLDTYRRLGVDLAEPHVVHNGTDPRVFHPNGRARFSRDRKIRLICSSWSDNPKKGTPTYRWLEDRLDWNRFEFTFVGNTSVPFARITHVPPVPPGELAELLRQHDVFVTATEDDAYSNALVEALSCGLPALYLASGGSGEAVKDAGLAFGDRRQIPELLERLVDEYEERQAAIDLPSLEEVTDAYLEVLGLHDFVGVRARA